MSDGKPEITSGSTTNAVVLTHPYKCDICGGYFLRGNVSCCVIHAPGECCHYGDQPINPTPSEAKKYRRENLRRSL